jgi:glycosyltransferase involved in cell wall biosynthesis
LDTDRYDPLFLSPAEGILPQKFRDAGIPVEVVPIHPMVNVFGGGFFKYGPLGKLVTFYHIIRYNFRIRKWLKEKDIDLVFCNGMRSVFYLGWAARLAKVPTIWFHQRGFSRSHWMSPLDLRVANRILVIAKECQNIFSEKDQKRFARKIVEFHHGFVFNTISKEEQVRFHREVREELHLEPDSILVGLVAAFHERKGHDLLIEAAPSLLEAFPKIRFLFIGDTSSSGNVYEQKIRTMLSERGLEKVFIWTGFRSDMPRIYSALEAVVLPSRMEGMPNTLIEALGYGIPVVATEVGGVRSIIRENVHGRVIPVDDSAALAGAIREVIEENRDAPDGPAELRSQFSRNTFSIENCVERFDQQVHSVLSKGSKS